MRLTAGLLRDPDFDLGHVLDKAASETLFVRRRDMVSDIIETILENVEVVSSHGDYYPTIYDMPLVCKLVEEILQER